MKKILKTLSIAVLAVLVITALFGCDTKADYTVEKKALTSLALEARTATAEETVSETEKAIPGSYKYKALTTNVTFMYDIPESKLEDVDRYTRLFKVSGPAGSTPYMLIVDDYTEDTANWTLWNVLGNIGYPAFQYTELKGGSGSPDTMKNFLEGKTQYKGYWGNASAGNSYESNKQENGNLKATLEFHFGADKIGVYTVTLEIVNLTDGAVLHTVSKTIEVR